MHAQFLDLSHIHPCYISYTILLTSERSIHHQAHIHSHLSTSQDTTVLHFINEESIPIENKTFYQAKGELTSGDILRIQASISSMTTAGHRKFKHHSNNSGLHRKLRERLLI